MSFSYKPGGAIATFRVSDRVFPTLYYPSDDFCKRSNRFPTGSASMPRIGGEGGKWAMRCHSATQLQALLLENESRHKTIEQKVREANTWRDIESELARIILENIAHSVRFDPQELKAIAKAPPPCPYQAGDLVRIDIDRAASIDAATQNYKGLWGIVQEMGELGSLKVDVGCATLQLLPFDLEPIDNPSPQLRDVALRLLRLRKLSLDEIEEKMLDVLQGLEWFTDHQLIHLETIEKLYSNLHSAPSTVTVDNDTNECQPPVFWGLDFDERQQAGTVNGRRDRVLEAHL